MQTDTDGAQNAASRETRVDGERFHESTRRFDDVEVSGSTHETAKAVSLKKVKREVQGHCIELDGGVWRSSDGRELVDSLDRSFDPLIHLTLSDGTPDLKAREPMLKRKSGRMGAKAEREFGEGDIAGVPTERDEHQSHATISHGHAVALAGLVGAEVSNHVETATGAALDLERRSALEDAWAEHFGGLSYFQLPEAIVALQVLKDNVLRGAGPS